MKGKTVKWSIKKYVINRKQWYNLTTHVFYVQVRIGNPKVIVTISLYFTDQAEHFGGTYDKTQNSRISKIQNN